jgi:hypothetical protein
VKTVTGNLPPAGTAAPEPTFAGVCARLPRCRMLNRHQNRCPNIAVTDLGVCAHHLAEAAAEYTALLAEHALTGAR